MYYLHKAGKKSCWKRKFVDAKIYWTWKFKSGLYRQRFIQPNFNFSNLQHWHLSYVQVFILRCFYLFELLIDLTFISPDDPCGTFFWRWPEPDQTARFPVSTLTRWSGLVMDKSVTFFLLVHHKLEANEPLAVLPSFFNDLDKNHFSL